MTDRRTPTRRALARVALALALVGAAPVLALAALGQEGHSTQAGAKASRNLPAPRLSLPGDDAAVQSVPAFSWSPVRRAAKYQFQLSADKKFGSIVSGGSLKTLNTFATLNGTLADGTYYWRVRAISAKGDAGRWSSTRALQKSWSARPDLRSPSMGETVVWPTNPLVLSWGRVSNAFKYQLQIATDPSLANAAPGLRDRTIRTSGTSVALPIALPPGRYYWAVTPLDSDEHRGARSAVGSFDWQWPTQTATRVADAGGSSATDPSGLPEVFSPYFSWDPVPGAARYQLEVNTAADFTPGSKVCCSDPTTGTSLSPVKFLANNVYHWRVRALDLDDNAGEWNYGPDFRKVFDDETPSIPNLRLRDNTNAELPLGTSTASPLVTWSPVTGASVYEVHVARYDSAVLNDCKWENHRTFNTATTAWTPLAGNSSGDPGPATWPSPSGDGTNALGSGQWCLRVFARSDTTSGGQQVVSLPTYLGGPGQPGFDYAPATVADPLGYTADSNYLSMTSGSVTSAMPVFRWSPVAGANSYYVIVAKDLSFTNVVDVALTRATVYAPRAGSSPKTYSDENTHYYWQVLPAAGSTGGTCHCSWDTGINHPQFFDKQSVPPTLLSPIGGETVSTQPTFRWSPADGARTYRLQVAQDPTFSDPINDLTTDSTAYTSSSTYPADTGLYWRVRANDERGVGLNWSQTGVFQRTLPVPTLSGDNPDGGSELPLITWSGVTGATSYDMHVEQADGTTKTFTMSSTAFTPGSFYGTGVWRWKIRANFAKAGTGETHGPYSGIQPFTRRIDAPAGTRYINTRRHMLLSWDATTNAGTKGYKVQVSSTDSFDKTIASTTTANTSWAPTLTQGGFQDGGTLYWRVATVDEGNNTGAWTTRTLALPKRMKIKVNGQIARRRRATVTVVVKDVRGRPVKRVRVKPSGAGVRGRAKRTTRKGKVTFRLRPTKKGSVAFTASKSGYVTTKVRRKVG
jgi:hypothetical protein